MKVIIDIPEDRYKQIKGLPNAFNSDICQAIRNGKPYNPTGDLISRDVLNDILELYKRYQPRLATNVYEFGVELQELLGRYGKEKRRMTNREAIEVLNNWDMACPICEKRKSEEKGVCVDCRFNKAIDLAIKALETLEHCTYFGQGACGKCTYYDWQSAMARDYGVKGDRE